MVEKKNAPADSGVEAHVADLPAILGIGELRETQLSDAVAGAHFPSPDEAAAREAALRQYRAMQAPKPITTHFYVAFTEYSEGVKFIPSRDPIKEAVWLFRNKF